MVVADTTFKSLCLLEFLFGSAYYVGQDEITAFYRLQMTLQWNYQLHARPEQIFILNNVVIGLINLVNFPGCAVKLL